MPKTNTNIDVMIIIRRPSGIAASVHHIAVGNSRHTNVTLNGRLRSPNIAIEHILTTDTTSIRKIAIVVAAAAEFVVRAAAEFDVRVASDITPMVHVEMLNTIHALSNIRILSTANGIWCNKKLNMP